MSKKDTYSEHFEYKTLCLEASHNPKVFNTFKSKEEYRSVLEHASLQQGLEHVIATMTQTPDLLHTHFSKFKTNDLVGNPVFEEFENIIGMASATTIQYIRVLSDLIIYFGEDGLKDLSIVEIGAGYGGQCKIISDYVDFKDYTTIDLPEPSLLTDTYLKLFKLTNTTSLDCYAFINSPYKLNADFVISNFAFSELSPHIQDVYLENIIYDAPKGYLWVNETIGAYTINTLCDKIGKYHKLHFKDDISSERSTNKIISWGHK